MMPTIEGLTVAMAGWIPYSMRSALRRAGHVWDHRLGCRWVWP